MLLLDSVQIMPLCKTEFLPKSFGILHRYQRNMVKPALLCMLQCMIDHQGPNTASRRRLADSQIMQIKRIGRWLVGNSAPSGLTSPSAE